MANVFLISDTHFGHTNICKFRRADGTKLRPWDDVQEMDHTLIQNWNNVVGANDKVYHLGDVFINRRHRFILDGLNGRKVLIKGNHDIFDLNSYTPFFKDIRAYHVLDKFILSHVPIHPQQMERFAGNIHGHLHEHQVRQENGDLDPRYLTVCVEHIRFTPVELSVAMQYFKDNGAYPPK